MAATSGIGGRFFLDAVDLSGNVGMLNRMSMNVGQQNTTTIQDEAMARTPTIRDGAMDWRGYFDDAGPHAALSTIPSTDRQAGYFHRATLGAPAWVMIAKQVSHSQDVTNGELHVDVSTVANSYGLELGHSLAAGKQNSTGAENLTGFDDTEVAADTNFGLQAYLWVFAFTGTSVDIQIQDSDDDGSVDPYADVTGASFTTVTGTGTERIQTGRTQAVKRWLRVELTGTYSNLDFAVAVVRNEVSTVF